MAQIVETHVGSGLHIYVHGFRHRKMVMEFDFRLLIRRCRTREVLVGSGCGLRSLWMQFEWFCLSGSQE